MESMKRNYSIFFAGLLFGGFIIYLTSPQQVAKARLYNAYKRGYQDGGSNVVPFTEYKSSTNITVYMGAFMNKMKVPPNL